MSEIKYQIPLQKDTDTIIKQFLQFYYNSLNEKNFDNLISLYKKYTEVKFNGQKYKGEDITHFINLIKSRNFKFVINNIDYLMSGNHRTNILVNGFITEENSTYNFSEYIHFGTSKENESGYWIQSSIIRININ